MPKTNSSARRPYFTTRDLLMMAVLAGLGGVASTAVNALGDAMQAALGFAGTTQWAAGLHVTTLLLAVGLTGKGGSATLAGLLKGGVELLSGNTHGLIILLIDLGAGLLIDLAFALMGRWRHHQVEPRRGRLAYMVAGGLGAASNVLIFQLFASAPEDVLVYVWGVAGLAFVSGALLGGLLAHSLLALLARSGIIREQSPVARPTWRYGVFLAGGIALAIGAGVYLSHMLAGPPVIEVLGECQAPYSYAASDERFTPITQELDLRGIKRQVAGVPLRDILAAAEPSPRANAVLVSASDGYSFFITLREVATNNQLVLAHRGEGRETSYEIAGAENPKAWVRNVNEMRIVPQALIEISGAVELAVPYNPDDWQLEMDNGRFDFGDGDKKYQGTLLRDIVAKWQPKAEAKTLLLHTRSGEVVELALDTVRDESIDLCIWNVNMPEGICFAVAVTDGEIMARDVVAIEIR